MANVKNVSKKSKVPRVIWHQQDIDVLKDIVTNMRTSTGILMTDILAKGSAKNIQKRKE